MSPSDEPKTWTLPLFGWEIHDGNRVVGQDGAVFNYETHLPDDTLRFRKRVMVAAAVLTFAAPFIFFPTIPQDPAFHDFGDKRTILGLNNFWNCVSNLPFAGSFWVAWKVLQKDFRSTKFHYPWEADLWATFFVAVGLVAPGSF